MFRALISAMLALSVLTPAAASDNACLGSRGDRLVESFNAEGCAKGDIVATKHPERYCDFSQTITFNDFNTAYCVYRGEPRRPTGPGAN